MKTLKQALGEYSEEQLKQLARWWGIGDAPEEGWRHHHGLLIQGMQDPIAVRFAWEQITEDESKVLHNLLNFSASNGVLRDVILNISRLPEANFEQALTILKQYMLVIEDQTTVRFAGATTGSSSKQTKSVSTRTTKFTIAKDLLAPLLSVANEIYTPNQDRTQMKLESILARLNVDRLYEIGRLYGFMLHDYYSRTLPSTRLVGQMVQPDVAFYAWEHLDANTHKLLRWLCENDGVATMQAAREYTGFDNSSLSAAIHTLERFALAFDTFSGTERKLFVPRELLKNLKKASAQPESIEDEAPAELVPLDTPPQTIRNGETLILYDLATIVGAMFQQNIEPTQSDRVPKRIASKLQSQLQIKQRVQPYYEGDETIDMLFNVALRLGLVKLSKSSADGIKPRYVQGPLFEKWSLMNVIDQTHSLLEFWLEGHNWIDIAGTNFDRSDSYYLDIIAGRKALISFLCSCAPGQWYSMHSLLRTIKDQDPYVLRPRQAAMGVSGFRSARNMMANWYKSDGEVLIGMLSSTLHELGIVTLGYQQPQLSEKDGPVDPDAFMLTDLATTVLETEGEPANSSVIPANERSLIVQPSFELLLLQPDLPTVYSLLPFAQVNKIGMVSRLTLTRNSVLRGVEAGRNIEQIIKILEEHSQKELPQNVVYTLRDWTKSYKEVTISQVLLLDVPSEAIANEICSSSKLSAFGLRKIAPCVIAADSGTNLPDLRRSLDKEGIVVRISGDIVSKTAISPTYRRY
ncbi:MAG TPA: helicase-associated domain-containing protein [Ktedonobacteraceae bacterium]|nr:helicase-associated domain-containing protein [Ktedonobacteraceae bacterium]